MSLKFAESTGELVAAVVAGGVFGGVVSMLVSKYIKDGTKSDGTPADKSNIRAIVAPVVVAAVGPTVLSLIPGGNSVFAMVMALSAASGPLIMMIDAKVQNSKFFTG